MRNSEATAAERLPKPLPLGRPSDAGPLVIIYTGARKAFKAPAWIIRTSARPVAPCRA